MNLNTSGRLCPNCNNENAASALVCRHCGAVLDDHPTNLISITDNAGGLSNIAEENEGSFIDLALIPEGGIGIYVAGAFKPYYLQFDREVIIGRQPELEEGTTFDLSELDAFNKGVSRHHAKIQRTETGFEVVDLSSRNGTWLNAEKLIPNRSYSLPSGSQLRIGQMRLFVIYRPVLNGAKKI